METAIFWVFVLVAAVDGPFLIKMLDEKRGIGFIQHRTAKIIILIVSPIVFFLVFAVFNTVYMMMGGSSSTSFVKSKEEIIGGFIMSLVTLGGPYACVFFSVRALFKKWSDRFEEWKMDQRSSMQVLKEPQKELEFDEKVRSRKQNEVVDTDQSKK